MPTPTDDQIALLKKAFAAVWAPDTSLDEDGWTSENPTWGHCAVAALAVQTVMGGELLRYDLAGTPFAGMRSHYRNRLPDGRVVDFTEAQFQGRLPENLPEPVVRQSLELLDPEKYPKTVERYERFKKRVVEAIGRLDLHSVTTRTFRPLGQGGGENSKNPL